MIPDPITFWWRRDPWGDHLLWLLPRAGTFDGAGDGRFVCVTLSKQTSKRWDAWIIIVRPARGLDGGTTKLRGSLKEAKAQAFVLFSVASAAVRLGAKLPAEWRVLP